MFPKIPFAEHGLAQLVRCLLVSPVLFKLRDDISFADWRRDKRGGQLLQEIACQSHGKR
jgi:hypothetical protein